VLTRKEKEEVVLDLYFNQNKTIREVAKTARKSPRDIGDIINRALKKKRGKNINPYLCKLMSYFDRVKNQ
jgi:hypothetical protein